MIHIPVIDMQRFYGGGTAARDALAAQVDEACRDSGFLTVTGIRSHPT